MKIEPYKERYADVRDAINYLLQFKNGIVLDPMPNIDCMLAHSEDVDMFLFDFRKDFGEEVYKDITAQTIGKPRMSWVCYKILKKIWKEDYRRNRNRGGRKSHNTVQTYDDGNVLIRFVG